MDTCATPKCKKRLLENDAHTSGGFRGGVRGVPPPPPPPPPNSQSICYTTLIKQFNKQLFMNG